MSVFLPDFFSLNWVPWPDGFAKKNLNQYHSGIAERFSDQKRGFKALAMDAILYPLVKEDAQYFSQQYNDLWAWQIELQ